MRNQPGNSSSPQPKNRWPRLIIALVLIAAFIYCFAQIEARFTLIRRIKKAEANLRALSQAMEAYSIDWSCPPLATDAVPGYRGVRYSWDEDHEFSTLQIDNLTTPIGYFKSHPKDPFSLTGRNDYCYTFSHTPWGDLLWSPGPDRVYDLNPYVLPDLLDDNYRRRTKLYHLYTYDPTNGVVSAGDIWRQVINHWGDPPSLENVKGLPLKIDYPVDIREHSLRFAAGRGDLDTVRKWVEDGVDINAKDLGGRTALHYAVRWDHIEIASCLIENGADADPRDGNGDSPLHLASLWSSLDLVEFLVKNGADVNAVGSLGETPIFCALDKKREDIAMLLADQEINVNAAVVMDHHSGYCQTAFSALYLAAELGHWDLVNLLLEKGADPNQGPTEGYGPIYFAIDANRLDTVTLFLEKDAKLWNGLGHTAKKFSKEGDSRMLELLLDNYYPNKDHSFARDRRSGKRPTPEMLARAQAVYEKARLLVDAARNGDLPTVEMMIRKGTNVHWRDDDRLTPLLGACSPELHGSETMQDREETQLAVAKALLKAESRINARTANGETPLDLALKNGLDKIAEHLRVNGGKTGIEPSKR